MKSKLIALSVAFVLLLLWGHETAYAQEPITNLDTGERFWTIQAAIDAANTQAGHTISVAAGIYNENVLLEKSLTLLGAGSEHTVVKAVTATQEVLLVQGTADEPLTNVTIEGFTFSGGHLSQPSGIYYVAGMRVVDAVNGHFRDIVIKEVGTLERGNYYGARVNNGGGHTFEDLTVDGLHGQFTWALELSATEDNTFTRTTITNTVTELNGFGLYLTNDAQRNVFTDTVISNIVSTDWVVMGFQLRRSLDNRLTRTTITGLQGNVQSAGIVASLSSARNIFTDTTIEGVTSAGDWGGLSVLGIHVSGAGVDDNVFRTARITGLDGPALAIGFTIQASARGTVYDDIYMDLSSAQGDTTGARIHNSADSRIQNSHITGGYYAIQTRPDAMVDILLEGNTLAANEYGVFVSASENNTITLRNNAIISNTFGVLSEDITNTVAALGNWWGSDSGPSGEGRGSGDAVYGKVDYCPWSAAYPDGELTGPVSNLDTGEIFCTIQEAIDAANTQAGHTISVTAGIYHENLTLHKAIRLVGASSDPAGTVISQTQAGAGDSKIGVVQIVTSGLSPAEPLLLQNLRIEPNRLAGISVGRFTEATGTEIAHVKLDNVSVIGTNTNPNSEQERGLYVDTTSSLRHLVVEDSAFEHLTYGWYFQKQVSAETSTVQYITVTNTSFSHNNLKGIYAEKLSDALFANCTVTGNGFSPDGVPSYFLPWMAGIDLNLKAGDYQNLTFRDCTVTDNALGGAAHGVGLAIKARDDGATYGAHPATLTRVLIEGGQYTGNERGIRLGEPGKANAGPLDVAIHHATFISNTATYTGTGGSATGDLINYALADVDATFNDWGVSDLAAIEARIYHQADDAGLGRVIYYTLGLERDPTMLMIDGVSTGAVTATLDGLLTPAGHTISFTTQLGHLSRITGTTDASGRVTLVYTPTADGVAIITATAGMAGAYPRHATTTLTILPLSTLHHFRVYLTQDQAAGVSFPVAISARDAADKVITAFNGHAWLTDTTGTLAPRGPIIFQNGVWNDLVTVTQAIAADLITVTAELDAQTTGQSIPFAVTPGPAVSAALAPASATVTAGQSLTYTVIAQDAFGNLWEATADAAYAIAPEAGGTWDGARYTTQYTGTWPITATVAGVEASAALTVTRGTPVALTLAPDPATLTAGERVTYTATAADSAGNRWDVTASAAFTAPLSAGGSWDANTYTTRRPGAWTLAAAAEGLHASATLHVITATVAALRLHPADATVTAGERLTYTVWATDTVGNSWNATAGAYITIDSPARGAWHGSTYRAEIAGTWRVTALYGGRVVTAALTVTPGPATALTLAPQAAPLAAGDSLAYTVTAQDAFGNRWDAIPDATFAITSEAGGAWAENQYTGEIAGDWMVTATYQSQTAAATLIVTPGPAVSATLAPASATVTAGQSLTYTVIAQDAFGNRWEATADAAYAIAPEAGGTWDGARYTTQYTGTWSITATVAGVEAPAKLTVTRGTPVALTLAPDPATLTAGERVAYIATAADSAGNRWDVTASAAFTAPLSAGGSWDANTYTTRRPGAWTLAAAAEGLHASATLHVITATVAALRLHPADATVTAGERLTYTVWATDTAGNSWDATSGAYFTVDSPARGSWRGSAYTSEAAGTWRVTALYGGQVAAADLTVTPGTAMDLTLSPRAETIAAGESLTYTVTARDAFGNAWDATADAALAIAPSAGGAWSGNQYTSEIAGAWAVTATVGAAQATAKLNVTHGPAASLTLTPASASITTGQSITYTVWASDTHGNLWEATHEANYAITPEAGGFWAGNVYHAQHAGPWEVTATVDAQSAAAQVHVESPHMPTTTYTLTINIIGEGEVILQPPGPVYERGQIVTLTAIPTDQWEFAAWSGALCGACNPITLTMMSDTTVTATFTTLTPQEKEHQLYLPLIHK